MIIDIGAFKMNVETIDGVFPADTVFIHGNLASNRWWQPAMSALRVHAAGAGQPQRKGRAFLMEWRGSGRSSAPVSADELAMPNLANDVVQAIEKLKLNKVNIVGHSTGGLIALLAMAQAPELFERAVLLDSVTDQGAAFPSEALAAFEQMSRDRAFAQMIMSTTIHDQSKNLEDPLFQGIVDDAFAISKHNWHGVPKALSGVDYSREISQIQHPVLVMHGEHDVVLPIAGSRELTNVLPNAQFIELKGQGHSMNVENPSEFVRLMTDFLFGDRR